MRELARAVGLYVLGAIITSINASTVAAQQPRTMDQVIGRVIENENHLYQQLKKYQPLVETYVQSFKPDKQLGYVPAGDKYVLGRADFSKGVQLVPLTDVHGKGKKFISSVGTFFSFSMQLLPDGFLQVVEIDRNAFNREHYKFDYVRREFLGDVRCLVFDVTPLAKAGKGRFLGRIWVEDQDFNIVRFNGGFTGAGDASFYFGFDSWRSNPQPGLWLPSFVYSEEKDLHYGAAKRFDFKGQTRLWAYNVGVSAQEQELSEVLVETPVKDDTTTANDLTPIQAQRTWDRQAEDNVIDRLQRLGLLAPPGDVDKVLGTVVNNLEVTNNIDLNPDIRCRVTTTTTLESFSIGHTIVLSRGLIDVLPDEASLATVLAHELSHAILGHRLDSQYAFFNNLLVDDKETFRHFGFARTPDEEMQANAKAVELLNNSPYKGQLENSGLFLRALDTRSREIPNLISPHLGNRVPVIADVKAAQPTSTNDPQRMVALPIGGRVKMDPWSDKLELIKAKPVGVVAEREKMPFEVTPFMPYLTRYGSDATNATSAAATGSKSDAPNKQD